MKRNKSGWMAALMALALSGGAAWAGGDTPLPGLWQTRNDDAATLRRELGPVMGTVRGDNAYTSPLDGVVTKWAEFDSWSYEGEIYLKAGTTYTFGSYVDDYCDISIDGTRVHSQAGWAFTASSYECTETGWHAVNIVLWDAGGGYGSATNFPGVAWNTTGQTNREPVSGWTQLLDPGDGSVFRVLGKPKRNVSVENVVCKQRYPWNGMVDIDYEVIAEDEDADVWVYCTGYDGDLNVSMAPCALSGEGVGGPVKPGKHRMTWNVTEDYPGFASTSFTVQMCALIGGAPYMVVDLSGGVDAIEYPVSYLSGIPAGGWNDEYKTTKMVFRLIPPGRFQMGSPTDELGRSSNETQHYVKLSNPFYIGVFEVTQKQYELVMGSNPTKGNKGDTRPVDTVSYNMIRGTVNGAAWPAHNQVDANSFMGRLRSKANMMFDLPTEAQWEYACRAGTGTALNSGKNLTGTQSCENLSWVGWYSVNHSGGQLHPVGQRLENAWGLYDMHGNTQEWCLDWYTDNLGSRFVIDPIGPSSGSARVMRGGTWGYAASRCRSSSRSSMSSSTVWGDGDSTGFRACCLPAD